MIIQGSMMERKRIYGILILLLFCGVATAQVVVKGNVYGGGEYGKVSDSACVTMNGGTVNHTVFGGGMGSEDDVWAGQVEGNTYVTMTGGQVLHSVYGGGELASVGTFNDTITVTYPSDDPNGNANKTVEIPSNCAQGTGLAKVLISGGQIGIDSALMPRTTTPDLDDYGYVFCGGMGLGDSIHNYRAIGFAVVDSAYLEISGGLITASAYGGSENGLVLHNVYVKMTGGQIGTGHRMEGENHYWDGIYTDEQWNPAIAAVANGTFTDALAAPFHNCDHWDYDINNYRIYDIYADPVTGNYVDPETGIATGTSSGGGSTHATNGHSFFGNLFGGGSGYYPIAPGVWRRTAGQVKGNVTVDIQGGHILTCVYGGNEYSDVLGKVTVNMSGGTIGLPRTVETIVNNPVTGMLFGGGMGDPRTAFNTWSNVGDVEINMTGGTIFGSLYGGGEDGHVWGDVVVNIDTTDTTKPLIGIWGNTNFDGNIFGGGRGFWGHALTAGTVAGNVNIDFNGGTLLSNIYGGGRLASVGTYLVDIDDANYGKFIEDGGGHTHGYITVNVNSGNIGHNVYGGSMGRLEQLDGTENPLWPRLAMAKHTKVNVTGGTIGENVYGGSAIGSVRDSSIVVIDGGMVAMNVFGGGMGSTYYSTSDWGNNDAHAVPAAIAGRVQGHTLVQVKSGTVKNNVYGGGQLASVGLMDTVFNANTHAVVDFTPRVGTGIANVMLLGGTVGLDTTSHNANNSPYYNAWGWDANTPNPDNGNIYGGSKGVESDLAMQYNQYGNVNHTRVTVAAGKVWGSVYGGSADGHVLGNDSVFITTGAMIGTDGTSSWDGNVFGGGKGNNTNYAAGRVGGNTYVDMTNGQVLGNIYGGGRLSYVGYGLVVDSMQYGDAHGNTKVRIRGGILGNNTPTGTNPGDPQVIETYSASSMGSIYGGGKGDINGLTDPHPAESALLVGMVKNTDVEVSNDLGNNTHVYGIVFGGGEVANVGNYTWQTDSHGHAYNINVTEGLAKINISGGIIGGDRAKMRYEHGDAPFDIYPKYNDDLGYVYGGGEGISDDPLHYDYIQQGTNTTDTISLVDLMATVNETQVTISGGWVKGSVFGGAEAGHVRRNTLVTIRGGQIGAGDDGTEDVLYTDGTGGSTNQFINPVNTPITELNALYGTTHWRFGDTIIENPGPNADTLVYYPPYDPVLARIDSIPSDGKSWFGNVFGGGSGWFPYFDTIQLSSRRDTIRSRWNPNCGKVWGNTHVVVEGGHILNNVYGGNEATDIGGNTLVEIFGGTVGVPRTKEQIIAQPCSGYVFGGGCGDPRSVFDTITLVDSTNVIIRGGIIYGSVYGGAEDGHVLGSTSVTVNQDSCTTVIGCSGLSTADGNIFGGGRNFFGENLLAGRVEGNIAVTMTSGTILGSIFGGGRQALSGIDREGNYPSSSWDPTKHGNVTINISGEASIDRAAGDTIYTTVIGNSDGRSLLCGSEESVGDVFGSGKGDTKNYENVLAGCVANTQLTITGSPRIYGGVFGGGEMASIGYLKDNNFVSGTVSGTGASKVTVGSETPAESEYLVIGTRLEYDRDHYMNDHPSHWTIYDTIHEGNRVVHTCSGNVYGGCQGDVDPESPNWIVMARSDTATVIINSGHILSSVFGGPEQGTMQSGASVTINGGTIGQTGLLASNLDKPNYDTTYNFGSVYGGGYGSDNLDKHYNAMCTVNGSDTTFVYATDIAGRVYGNTAVTINGGTIRQHVFGGGEMASVSGNTLVTILDVDMVGPLDNDTLPTSGCVYAAGKGIPSDDYKDYCNVNNAKVVIGSATGTHSAIIRGDVYGGGADCHVLGNDSVFIHNGAHIGTQGITDYDGNVFGGGRGSGYYNDSDKFVAYKTCGRVGGNTYVSMDGGDIRCSIFGGGRLALTGINDLDVHGNPTLFFSSGTVYDSVNHGLATINVSGTPNIGNEHADTLLMCDYSVGDIFGSGKGDILEYDDIWGGRVAKAQINISGSPTIRGSVFGGGEMASIGYWDEYGVFYTGTGHAEVNIGMPSTAATDNPTIGTAAEFNYTDPEQHLATANPGQWTIYDDDHKIIHTCTGNVFGGCQGDVDTTEVHWVSMGRSRSSVVNVRAGSILGSVFGGSEQGVMTGNTQVVMTGGHIGTSTSVGSSSPYVVGDLYGAGYGSDDPAEDDNTHNDSTAMVKLLAGRVYGDTRVDLLGGTLAGSVFGGSSFAYVGDNAGLNTVTVNVVDTIQHNLNIEGNVYGGNNRTGTVMGATVVNVNAGNLGNAIGNQTDVFGGGFGEATATAGNVTVTVDSIEGYAAPVVYGDIYGGSAFGQVNSDNDDVTTVNIIGGTIKKTTTRDVTYGGNVYGGGLGQTGSGNAAKGQVNGEVVVNVGEALPGTSTYTHHDTTFFVGYATIENNVYGCNNTGGSPKDTVTVNIYGTHHTLVDMVDSTGFAIDQVFGGGNYADNTSGKSVYVNIFGCDNTIRRVFGGSDASAAPNVNTDIQGGRMDNVFGGGNGELIPADINGNIELAIHGGKVRQFFVGSNQHGSVSGTQNVKVDSDGPCSETMDIDEFFCGGNFVDVIGNVTATIDCHEGMVVRNLYGGCNKANIKDDPATPAHEGNVYLTVKGGTFENVYGGSKGDLAAMGEGHIDTCVVIEGNVNLTICGGTIDTVFGACNINGNVLGKITITVYDSLNSTCPLVVHNVYGGGRTAAYRPTFTGATPEVNILRGTIAKDSGLGGNVFGGGYGVLYGQEAIVRSNPRVTIGDSDPAHHSNEAIVEGNVYGGGDGAAIEGDTHVLLDGTTHTYVAGSVYGGGNNAAVNGNAKVEVKEPTTNP